jgi:hypothetical protein
LSTLFQVSGVKGGNFLSHCRSIILCLMVAYISSAQPIAANVPSAQPINAAPNVGVGRYTYFKVDKINGKAFARAPFALEWEEVEQGSALIFGTNLKIEKSTKIELSYSFNNQGSWKAVQTYLSFNTDASVILNQNLLRRIKLRKYFFSFLRQDKGGAAPEAKVEEVDFKKAWDRVASFFKPEKDSVYSDNLQSDNSIQVALRNKKITVHYPEDGLTKYALSFPASLPVVWVHPTEKTMSYKLYFWRHNTDYSEPYAITTNDNYSIQVTEPGSYFFQVSSVNGRFASKPHIVHFIPQMPEISLDNKEIVASLALVFPLRNYALFGDQQGASIDFVASISSLTDIKELTLQIQSSNEEKTKVYQLPLQLKIVTTQQLAVNSYTWWLEGKKEVEVIGHGGDPEKKIEVIISEKRRLEVLPVVDSLASQKIALQRLLDGFIQNGRARKIMISSQK